MVTGSASRCSSGKIHMDVEPLGLAIGETIGNNLEPLAHRIQVGEPLLQAEVAQIVGEPVRYRRNRENFSYCFRKEFFPSRLGRRDDRVRSARLPSTSLPRSRLLSRTPRIFADVDGAVQPPEPEFNSCARRFCGWESGV